MCRQNKTPCAGKTPQDTERLFGINKLYHDSARLSMVLQQKNSGRPPAKMNSTAPTLKDSISYMESLGKKIVEDSSMTKTDIINEVVYEMSADLTKEQQERLKVTFLVKMHDYDITEIRMLPAMDVHDNDWLLKRYIVDSLAADRKESTVRAYVRAVNALFRETGKHYSQLTSQDIIDFLAIKQQRDKIGQNYKSTLYRYFSAFFGWAYDNEHIKSNIMNKVPHVKQAQKRKERLTDEEIEDIRDACHTLKEKALVELLLSTGMRVGEVSALNRSDLDLQHKRVSIYGEKTNRYRTGMLTTKAVKALRKYIASREYCTDALFISDRKPYNRLQNSSIEKMVKDIALRSGLTRIPVTVHVYRKTFASIMYKKTKDILLVSKLLGHAKTDMTVQYYLIDDLDDMQYRYNAVNG